MAGASFLVLQWAGGRSLWLDEEMIAINFRERTLRALASPLWLGQTAPYGWLVLERLTVVLLGTGERALRLVPLVFGVATLGTAVWIGRRWMGTAGAAVLTLLCAMGEWLAFHVHELKHYSADTCFALLLPGLAAWVTELPSADHQALRQRVVVFWIVAVVAQWFSNGALFVTPATAAILITFIARRFGWRAATQASLFGLAWLLSFALNDVASLRHARASRFLQGVWAIAFPPPAAGIAGTLRWLADQLTPLAVKPGGSGYGLTFWVVALTGLAIAARRSPPLGLAFAAVPVSAFILAAARIVPLYERLSIWIVPALYTGVAFAADAVAGLFDPLHLRWNWRLLAGAAAASLLVALCADVVVSGTTYLRLRPQKYNHELDDRDAVRWLRAQHRTGDVWLTTHLALPAIWWYDAWNTTTPVFEASFTPHARDCGHDDVRAVMRSSARALLYLGFRFDDVPKGFDDLLLMRLGEIGALTAYRRFGVGHAVVIDFGARSSGPLTLASVLATSVSTEAVPIEGCVAVRPAQHW